MAITTPQQDIPAFVSFLSYLRRQQGFDHIGVDHYVRVQALFNNLGFKYPFADLKLLLRPVCTTSQEQQKQFDDIFDQYLTLVVPSEKTDGSGKQGLWNKPLSPEVDIEPQREHWLRRWVTPSTALQVLVGALLTALIYWLIISTGRAIQSERNVPASSSSTPSASPPGSENTMAANGNFIPSNTNGGTINNVNSKGDATEANTNGSADNLDDSNPQASTQIAPSDVALPLILVGGGLLLFAGHELFRYFRRQQFIRDQLNKKLPYVWHIEVELPGLRLFDVEKYNRAVLRMRQRQVDEFYHMDVPATIAATIETFGYPSYRYRAATRTPEYLILIDRASFLDHQAQMAFELASALKKEGLFVAIYFFEDPHLCCDPAGKYVRLSHLQARYAGHRLLVFSNGHKYLDPLTGELSEWNKLFKSWPERALLTPKPTSSWGPREATLANQFIILPSTMDGFTSLVSHFEAASKPAFTIWQRHPEDALPEGLERPGGVEKLRRYLGENLFRWLCACAVYSELQWHLTLYLGSLLSDRESLLTEKNLWRLIRLPWFRVGLIPDDLRESLIAQLSRTDETAVRSAIIILMGKAKPGDDLRGTVAEAAYEMNLRAQYWLRDRDRNSYRNVVQNTDLAQHLMSASTLLSQFRAFRAWREQLFKGGTPALGLKTGLRVLITMLGITLACAVAYWTISPGQPSSPGSDDSNQNTFNVNNNTQANTNLSNTSNSNNSNAPDINNSNVNINNGDNRGNRVSNTGNGNRSVNINRPVDNSPIIYPPRNAKLFDTPNMLTMAKIDEFRFSLNNTPTARALILYYDGNGMSKKDAQLQASSAKTVLIARGMEATRISMGYGGKSSQYNLRLFAVPTNNQGTPSGTMNRNSGSANGNDSDTGRQQAPYQGGVLNGKAISLPRPPYPPEAKANRAGGTVTVQVLVDETGKVVSAKAITGHALLLKPAEEAAYQARFSPMLISGRPVKVKGVIAYSFVMD